MTDKSKIGLITNVVLTLIAMVAFLAAVITEGEVSSGAAGWLAMAFGVWGSDLAKWKSGGSLVLLLGIGLLGSTSCSSLPSTFLTDSQAAIQSIGDDYAFNGCSELTLAPEITGSLEGDFHLSGGILIGCRDCGELVEFYCKRIDDEVKCESLGLWYREVTE